MIKSKINPMLTLDYITHEPENKYFDRKSARIRPVDLAPLISAFANAEGGTIVIGVDDYGNIEGVNNQSPDRLNDFISAAKDYCQPMPANKYEYLDVINKNGQNDRLLLLHIAPAQEQIIQTRKDETWLRIGDRTKELKGTDLRNLEYTKNTRRFEDECSMDAGLDDLDVELLKKYQQILGAEDVPIEQVLQARGLIRRFQGENRLTNAAVLLFAKNIMQFYPNCRVRFVRYEGDTAKTGTQFNVIKDKNIDACILRLVDIARRYIAEQLREFTALDTQSGKFKTVPEYPEFAWLEGIVNAIVHREYSLAGDYILVSMYDDHLEIKSPGRLPGIVTIENIKHTRYARNPKISRVLTEFGYVRELNEGVKRIYSDMEAFFLDDPEYSEPGQQTVKLTLKNNIVMRKIRQKELAQESIGTDVWEQLDDLEREILTYMGSQKSVTRRDLEERTGKARNTILNRLKHLLAMGVIKQYGRLTDPNHSYSID